MGTKISVLKAGYIDLSGKVVVSDPCYDRKSWRNAKDIAVRPGRYAAYILTDEQDGGARVASIMVIHEECLGLMKERVESMSGGWAVRYVSASDKMKENAERKMQVYGGRGENMID